MFKKRSNSSKPRVKIRLPLDPTASHGLCVKESIIVLADDFRRQHQPPCNLLGDIASLTLFVPPGKQTSMCT